MTDKPRVSVVIATYNYAHYVVGAIQSALAQTLADLEVIVVDDGSTDYTEAVVQPFMEDSRVRYIKTENRGQPAAKNTGIMLSRAPYIAFLDADDAWLPTKLTKQIALFEADPDLGVVYSRRYLIDPDGQELEYTQPTLYHGKILDHIFTYNFICFSTTMVSQRVFQAIGLFDERRRQNSDYDLWIRAAHCFRFDYLDEPLVLYRQGHASLKGQTETLLASTLEIMSEFLDQHGGRTAVSPAAVRNSYAMVYKSYGFLTRPSDPLKALGFFARSIKCCPTYLEPWLGILGIIPFPESVRRQIRRLLGRPIDLPRPRTGRKLGLGPREAPEPAAPATSHLVAGGTQSDQASKEGTVPAKAASIALSSNREDQATTGALKETTGLPPART